MSDPATGALAEGAVAPSPLAGVAESVPFFKGDTFGRQGTPCGSLYVIQSGHVLLGRLHEDGDTYALGLLGPGELFGEGAVGPGGLWTTHASAATDGTLFRLAVHSLPRAMAATGVGPYLLGLLAARIERAQQRIDLLTLPGARQRLVGLLRLMAGSFGQPREHGVQIPIRLTRTAFGEMLGLARETVSRVLGEMEEQGQIRWIRGGGVWVHGDLLAGNGWSHGDSR